MLASDVFVIAGDIWVERGAVDERHTDLVIDQLARVGDLESTKLSGCNELDGNIEIRNDILGYSDEVAATIPAFRSLERVTGDVSWLQNTNRLGINAFPNVELVGGTIRIEGATGVFSGFASLLAAGGITAQGKLAGFESIKEVSGLLRIQTFEVAEFPQLESVGNLRLASGDAFRSPNLETVNESVTVIDVAMDEADFMPTEVGGNISIRETGLLSLGGKVPRDVGGGVFITSNPMLDSAAALAWAESIPVIRGASDSARELGEIYVCQNLGSGGNCPGEDNHSTIP